MERYYCHIVPDSLDHVSPSTSMLLEEIEGQGQNPSTVLDIGCGNGRNSIALAYRYNSKVTIADADAYMLDWAAKSFTAKGKEDVEVMNIPLEQLAGDGSILQSRKFDVVILSYVLQFVNPSHYERIFDFLQQVCQGYLAIDIFWNPSRCEPGARVEIGRSVWYGVRYEELVQLIAPRFEITRQRVQVDSERVMINLIARQGVTPPERIVRREYDYYLGQLRVSCRGWSPRRDRRAELIGKIENLPSYAALASIYPGEMDLVKSEIKEWLESGERIRLDSLAAKYLLLCRATKVPVFLREVTRDFNLSNRRLLGAISACDYIPPLGTADYIGRASRELGLNESVIERAMKLERDGRICGVSPTVRAGCAILASTGELGIKLETSQVARHLAVSPVALRTNLQRRSTR